MGGRSLCSHAKDVLMMGHFLPNFQAMTVFYNTNVYNRMAFCNKNLFCNDFLNAYIFSRLQLELHDHMTSLEGIKLLSGTQPPSDTLA